MGRRFEFSLEPLLAQRRRIEEEKRRDFAECRRSLDEWRCDVDRRAAAFSAAIVALHEAARSQAPADLRLHDGYLRHLRATSQTRQSERAGLQTACDRARDALVAANRERRVVERLRERRFQAFQAAQTRREELERDADARRRERARRKSGAA